MIKRLTLSLSIVLLALIMGLAWLMMTDAGFRVLLGAVKPLLPVALEYRELEGNLLRGVSVRDLAVELPDGSFNADSIVIDWQWRGITQLHIRSLAVQHPVVDITPRTDQQSEPVQLPALPLALVVDEARIVGPQLRLAGEAIDLPQSIVGALALRRDVLEVSRLDVTWPEAAVSGKAIVTQLGQELTFEIAANGSISDVPGIGPLSATISLEGTPTLITVQALRLNQGDVGSAIVTGLVNLAGSSPGFDLAAQIESWQYQDSPETSLRITAGDVAVNGTVDEYALTANAHLHRDGLPEADITVRADGNSNAIAFSELTLRGEGFNVDAPVQVSWAGGVAASGTVRGTDFNPALLAPDWPGRISFAAEGDFAMADDGPAVQIRTLSANGELRQRPLTLRASPLSYQRGVLSFSEIVVNTGQSSLAANGRVGDDVTIDWELNSPDLADLLPGAGGTLDAKGMFRQGGGGGALVFDGSGSGIVYQQWRLQGLSANGEFDLRSKVFDGSARFEGAANDQWVVKEISFLVKGSPASHEATVTVNDERGNASLMVNGALVNEQWQGTITQLNIEPATAAPWRLRAPAAVTAGSAEQHLAPLCLDTANGNAICLQGDHEVDGSWQAQGDVSGFPLAQPAAYVFESFVKVDGTVDAHFNANGAGSVLETLEVRSHGEAISMALDVFDDLQQVLDIDSFDLVSNYADGQAQVDATLVAEKHAPEPTTFALTMTGINPAALDTAAITTAGTLRAHWNDLSAVSLFVPAVADMAGQLNVALDVAGTVAQPRIAGEFTLRDGVVELPATGVRIVDMNLTATGDPSGAITITGGAVSGTGKADFDGTVTFADGLHMTGHIGGDRFEIMRTTAARVAVSPDVNLRIDDHAVAISGSLTVPSALIEPMELRGTTQVSSDVVIVGDQQPAEQPSLWQVDTAVRVVLGEDVKVQSKLFEFGVTGDIRLTQKPQRALLGRGTLLLNGEVKAYGESLQVADGKLMFEGGELDEARIDARAVREIADDNITVGVLVTGPTTAPTMTLFSSPSMAQDSILSYLVLGRPLNEVGEGESPSLLSAAASLGIRNSELVTGRIAGAFSLDELSLQSGATLEDTSFVVGKYISPRLYISYGMGLFDALGTAKVRYDITNKWSVQGEQGRESVIEILFKLEH
ncbi:MAG: translocation/assembly module TamB domain-containing protein [Gammaproteobacteria bacterium]|nr:translocation/assembly module TamB domain-containing protein [Gammaproteobacteria bacterium]